MHAEQLAIRNDGNPPVFCEDLLHLVEYPAQGIFSVVLTRSVHCTFTLLGLAARNAIAFHDSGGNISIQVVHGRGILDLISRKMEIEEGMFLFIPSHTTQGVVAETNLALLHCVIHE